MEGFMKKLIQIWFVLFFCFLFSCRSTPEPAPDPARRIIPTMLNVSAGPNQTEVYITRSIENQHYSGYIPVFLDGSLRAEVARGSTEKIIVDNGVHEISVGYPNGGTKDPIKFRAMGGRLDFRTYLYQYKQKGKNYTGLYFVQEGGKSIDSRSWALGIVGAQTLKNVTKKSKIAIVYIIDQHIDHKGRLYYPERSGACTRDLEINLINDGYIIIDRAQLDKIRQEQNFQLSGEVDDATAVSIGKFAGADIIITGKLEGNARLSLRALNTQTAQVIGAASERW
jgi:hypothetical protein